MRLASAARTTLAAAVSAATCVGCGSSSNPAARVPVSLQELHGNAFGGVTHDLNLSADGRLSVQRLARTARLTATEAIVTTTNSAGRGRLNGAERAQLNAALRHVDLRQLRAAGVTGACHGAPIGDVGGVLLDVGGTETDCAPASARPLVSWLLQLALATPEKVTHKSVYVTHLRRTGARR